MIAATTLIHTHTTNLFSEGIYLIMYQYPAETPARDQELLADPSTHQDWYIGSH